MIAEIVSRNIKALREEHGLTQQQAGEILRMSRATYNGFESGKRPPAIDELEKLANYYGVPVNRFFNAWKDDLKFRQIYLRILEHFPDGVPKTKLAKLLYLIDFSNFYYELESMSGVDYIRRQYGPVAENFFEVTDDMYETGKIDIEPVNETFLIKPTIKKVEYGLLSEKDIKRIDEVCELWKDKRTSEIVEFTHEQNPWRSCRDGERIPYVLIIQEEPDNVYTPT